ncbi:MAG: hypothetical protein LAN62_05020 [Acidobacteriia bacterium]|nr:hypothetical protein [Terriglobia bacterium]
MSGDVARFEREFLNDPALAERVLGNAKESRAPTYQHSPADGRLWPDPPAVEAYQGLAGDFVAAIEPHSEADPIALLVQFLCMFGNVIGRGSHFTREADRHFTNLFAVLVGATSKGRKGTSQSRARAAYEAVDTQWAQTHILSGLSSGEGVIWAVRDPITKRDPIRERGRVTGFQEIEADPGIADKRLLVFESEFALVLRVMTRESNTLAAIIRQAWDTGNLRTLTKNSPAAATGAHISIIGHITVEELRRYITETELASGFANRFLWLCVKRSKCLPDDDHRIDQANLAFLTDRLRRAVEFARQFGEIKRDDAAHADWRGIYSALTAGRPGLLGAATSRAEAQTMRAAMVYALLDCSPAIRQEHLRAALALWQYAEASAKFIFGDALGDPTADAILEALQRNPLGLTRNEICDLFGRHKSRQEVERALRTILAVGAGKFVQEQSGGRPTERWLAL